MPIVSSILLGCMGIIIGYLAQRSRMCFVAGFRDFIIIRDREVLMGFFTFLCTVWVLTSVLYTSGLLHQGIPQYKSVKELTEVEEKAMKLSAEAMGGPEAESGITVLGGITGSGGVRRGVGNTFMAATVIGGWLLGFLSVLAGGCVMRQHVLCAQGQRNSLFFIIGFYCGSVFFYTLLFRFFDWIY